MFFHRLLIFFFVSSLIWAKLNKCGMSLLVPHHTLPEEFENGGFTLKTHQMLSVHTTLQEFRNAKITGHFGYLFQENSSARSHHCSVFKMCFVRTQNVKPAFSNSKFKEHFREAPFSRRISASGRPKRTEK